MRQPIPDVIADVIRSTKNWNEAVSSEKMMEHTCCAVMVILVSYLC